VNRPRQSKEAGPPGALAPEEKARVARLVRRLGSRNRSTRVAAENALRRIGVAAVEPILFAVAEERRRRRRVQLAGSLTLVACVAALLLAQFFLRGPAWANVRVLTQLAQLILQ
jgi:hypothetical protein